MSIYKATIEYFSGEMAPRGGAMLSDEKSEVLKFYKNSKGQPYYTARSVRALLRDAIKYLYGGGRYAKYKLSDVDKMRFTPVLLQGDLTIGKRSIIKLATSVEEFEQLQNAKGEFYIMVSKETVRKKGEEEGEGRAEDFMPKEDLLELLRTAGAFQGLSFKAKMGYGRFTLKSLEEATLDDVNKFMENFRNEEGVVGPTR